MFGHSYFGAYFFGGHYFGPAGTVVNTTNPSRTPIIASERGNSVSARRSRFSVTAPDGVSIRAGSRGFAIRAPRRGVITSENS